MEYEDEVLRKMVPAANRHPAQEHNHLLATDRLQQRPGRRREAGGHPASGLHLLPQQLLGEDGTVMGTASSSGQQRGESGNPSTSSTSAITFLIQEALISGGLVGPAHDPTFLTMTMEEMSASSQLEMDEMEKAALELLKGRETLQDTKTGSAL